MSHYGEFAVYNDGCHCHYQDERCTDCCINRKGATTEEFAAYTKAAYVGDLPSQLDSGSNMSFMAPVGAIEILDLTSVIDSLGAPLAFTLYRGKDSSGVSGTGKVLEGIIFSDCTVAVHWCTEEAPASTTVYDNADGSLGWYKFVNIHVQPHPFNETRIEFKKATTKNSTFDAHWTQKADALALLQKAFQEHYGHTTTNGDCDFCKTAVRPTVVPTPTPIPYPYYPYPASSWLYCAVCSTWYYSAAQHFCTGVEPNYTPPFTSLGGHIE